MSEEHITSIFRAEEPPTRLHDIIIKTGTIFILTAAKTWELISYKNGADKSNPHFYILFLNSILILAHVPILSLSYRLSDQFYGFLCSTLLIRTAPISAHFFYHRSFYWRVQKLSFSFRTFLSSLLFLPFFLPLSSQVVSSTFRYELLSIYFIS